VGKTYRKIPTGKSRKKNKLLRGKNFRIKQKIQLELDYENETEVSKLSVDYLPTNS